MLHTERRVVITGLGLITPLGIGLDPFWEGLATGRGAVRKIQAFAVDGLPIDAGGEVTGFDPKALAIPKHRKALTKSLKYMARDIQLAVAAAEMALADAGLAEGGVDPTRIGVDLGAGLISSELEELAPAISLATRPDGSFNYEAYGREGIPQIQPIWLLKYLPNMLACHISILSDCQGPSNTITEAEAASNVAIGEACRIIARGRADVMIAGGADSKIHPLSLIRMSLLEQMSHWPGDPSQACRPFDRQRDGWVPGEGAGILILEEREHAQRRGARIYGEILGYGSGCDAAPGGGLDPEGTGTEIALRAALHDAGLRPSAIGHVNAHGAATVASDLAEARAFRRLFGEDGPGVPVTALKGFVGNLVSGCGAVELIGSLLGVNRGLIPPTLNCDEPDPACGLDIVHGAPRPTTNPIFVKTNLTRHGQAAALVVRGNPIATADGPAPAEERAEIPYAALKG
ncbi:MAG: beta-ketoacyl-[acyl-carrier-protein] synthase family protein [Isosphaeraceae bacterium]|nr:beta-ketoacyl-[acyl-carrier-protein] synthase family protein [Isosphaeraceae bacterium]